MSLDTSDVVTSLSSWPSHSLPFLPADEKKLAEWRYSLNNSPSHGVIYDVENLLKQCVFRLAFCFKGVVAVRSEKWVQ